MSLNKSFFVIAAVSLGVNSCMSTEDQDALNRYRAMKKQPCKLQGLAGEYPKPLCDLVQCLSKVEKDEDYRPMNYLVAGDSRLMNRLAAEAVARESGAALLMYSGSELIGKLQSSGSENVSNMFKEAEHVAEETQKPVRIYLDGVDYFACENDPDGEHTRAKSTLRIEMDRCKEKKDLQVY